MKYWQTKYKIIGQKTFADLHQNIRIPVLYRPDGRAVVDKDFREALIETLYAEEPFFNRKITVERR